MHVCSKESYFLNYWQITDKKFEKVVLKPACILPLFELAFITMAYWHIHFVRYLISNAGFASVFSDRMPARPPLRDYLPIYFLSLYALQILKIEPEPL